ncbi:hypothetical protein D3C85_1276150 [compost metagenome]
MAQKFVQFSDETETVIVSVFGVPQDDSIYPHQGNVDETDERHISFMDSIKPH